MLYDQETGIYIRFDGRAYEPLSGRYLQRDPLGPDAIGNVYGYRHTRAALLVQHRQPYPFTEGLEALFAAQTAPQPLTAASVRQSYAPRLSLAWQDMGLEALHTFNQNAVERMLVYQALPMQLADHYNPAGVVVGANGAFMLMNQQGGLNFSFPTTQWSGGGIWDLSQIAPLLNPDLGVPHWFQAEGWRVHPLVLVPHTNPQPIGGARSPGALPPLLAYPLGDLSYYADLFVALEHLPTQPLDPWLAQIDTATLPTRPTPPPSTGQAALEAWFTWDTLPTWEKLRAMSEFPPAPGAPPYRLHLQ
jgi:hypothetical protein